MRGQNTKSNKGRPIQMETIKKSYQTVKWNDNFKADKSKKLIQPHNSIIQNKIAVSAIWCQFSFFSKFLGLAPVLESSTLWYV